MIAGSLDMIEAQAALIPGLDKAVAFLRRTGIDELQDGKYEIEGDAVFALVQRYETIVTDTPRFEYHQNYVDLQFIARGNEEIAWIPSYRIVITEAYDPGADICFGMPRDSQWSRICLQERQAALFYPNDGHAPRLAAGAPETVMKIVVKIAVKRI